MNSLTPQIRNYSIENGPGKIINMHFSDIFGETLQKKVIEKE